MKILSSLALVITLLGGGNAFAQTSQGQTTNAEGRISAVSFLPVDKKQPVSVRVMDDSRDNMMIKQTLERSLSNAGYIVAQSASQVMTFEASNSLTSPKPETESVVSFDASASTYTDQMNAKVKLLSSSENSLLNRKADEGPQGTAGSFRLDLQIMDRSNGKRLWQGWAVAGTYSSDGTATVQSMAPELISKIGTTVRNQPFAFLVQ
jgi:hypothetical protein